MTGVKRTNGISGTIPNLNILKKNKRKYTTNKSETDKLNSQVKAAKWEAGWKRKQNKRQRESREGVMIDPGFVLNERQQSPSVEPCIQTVTTNGK